MIFSKSLSYAIRGVLYIAGMQHARRYCQSEEIAEQLSVPRHFMSKILKKLAKERIITSVKGPTGGFTVTEKTSSTTLMDLLKMMEGGEVFRSCVLRLAACSEENPCPVHVHMRGMRDELQQFLSTTTIEDLISQSQGNKAEPFLFSEDPGNRNIFHINLSK